MCYTVTHDVTSSQPRDDQPSPRDAYLDAARDCILDVGWRRTTLTEVARRAGVSRMTIYRTWADMPQLLADLMTREWGGVVADALADEDPDAPTVERLVGDIVGTVRRLRENELFVRIVELDPELILPYLFSRRGRSQDAILELTVAGDRATARPPARSAPATRSRWPAAMLLAAHGFVLSAHTMVDDEVTARRPRRRARRALTRGACSHDPPPGSRPASPAPPTEVDLVVIGLGITGAGVALDAVTRGLSVLAVDAHDLAFGTSRWSSKLVHGGLRYLAKGQFGVAHESAVERGILMERHRAAPHPRAADADPARLRVTTPPAGGPHRRRPARPATCCAAAPAPPPTTLPRPRRLSATEALQLAPALRAGRAARRRCSTWDGQLEDDARLVTNVARTAASYGAHVRTRARVLVRHRHLGRAARRADRRDARPSPRGRSSTPPASGPATWSPR